MEKVGLDFNTLLGLCQVGVLSGIFLRLGNLGGRIKLLENWFMDHLKKEHGE